MRSLLFVPGDSEKKQSKAALSGADALILDLEDSVSLAHKEGARLLTQDYLGKADRTSGPKLIVRMNALDTPFWRDDLDAIAPAKPDAIMIPKTLSGDCVHKVSKYLDRLEGDCGLARNAIQLCNVATETAASLFTMGTYQGASARLFALTWGAEDLAADLGASSNMDDAGNYTGAYQLARTLSLAAAVAADAMPIDSIYKDFKNMDGLRAEARAALRDGFVGKMAIHPAQVPIINEVFTPTREDVAHAQTIIDAFEEAGNPGVIALEGVMLDQPHLKQAKRLVARAT